MSKQKSLTRAQREAKSRSAAATARAQAKSAEVNQPSPADAAPPNRTYYLDVSAVRIQSWLGRTPELRLRRGASYLLEKATAPPDPEHPDTMLNEIQSAHPELSGLTRNVDAGNISGVVNLQFTASDDVAARGRALLIAAHVANTLRSHMPALPLTAWSAPDTSYIKAYAKARKLPPLLDLPVAQMDTPASLPCAHCGLAAATTTHPSGGVVPQTCRDCAQRARNAGSNRGKKTELLPRSSVRLAVNLEKISDGTAPMAFPADFDELAALGRASEHDEPTHLATVFADGNQVGRLMAKLAQKDPPPAGANHIVALLDEVTGRAVAHSVHEILQMPGSQPRRLDWTATAPIILHLAGGDDVLASVPAPLGWAFARSLARNFDTLTEDSSLLSDKGGPEKSLEKILGVAPSISSAIVFHHHSAPFADVVHRAEDLLHRVKQSNRGKAAAIGFLDLTDDGGWLATAPVSPGTDPTYDERCLTAEEIEKHAPLLDDLAAVSPSQRSTLRDLLRQHPAPEEEPVWRATIADRVRRMGSAPVGESILSVPASASAKPSDIVGAAGPAGEAARRRLRRDLDIARWWLAPSQLDSLKEYGNGKA